MCLFKPASKDLCAAPSGCAVHALWADSEYAETDPSFPENNCAKLETNLGASKEALTEERLLFDVVDSLRADLFSEELRKHMV